MDLVDSGSQTILMAQNRTFNELNYGIRNNRVFLLRIHDLMKMQVVAELG